MSWANDIVTTMRQQGSSTPSSGGIKLGVMTGPASLRIGNLILSGPDLLFADHLLQPKCTKAQMDAPDGGGACTDESTYLPALSAGDRVAVVQISDTQFFVLERMVSA